MKKKQRPVVHMANSGLSPEIEPDNGFSETKEIKSEEKSARNEATSTHARDPETGLLRLRPGQASIGSKLDDAMEEKICAHIADGLIWADACFLCGIDRVTAYRWKTRGAEEPDSRYAVFLERCEMAELTAKKKIINKILASNDERSLRWFLQNRYPKEFKAEHFSTELSGPDGQAIPVSVSSQAFNVVFQMPSGDPIDWKTVNHRKPAEVEAQPQQTKPSEPEFINGHKISQVLDTTPDTGKPTKLNPYDPLGPRTYERGYSK